VAQRSRTSPQSRDDRVWDDRQLAVLLEQIEQEEVPERLLTLARRLQEQLQLSRGQGEGPH